MQMNILVQKEHTILQLQQQVWQIVQIEMLENTALVELQHLLIALQDHIVLSELEIHYNQDVQVEHTQEM